MNLKLQPVLKNSSSFALLLVPIVFIFLFVFLAWYDGRMQKKSILPVLHPQPIAIDNTLYYPQLTKILGSETNSSQAGVLEPLADPIISAYAAIVLDDESKVMLYGKNENVRLIPASTTKMLTALVALDYFGLDDVLEYKQASAYGSVIGLGQGEKMNLRNLLYAMLLPSGNDASLAISQNVPGGTEVFVDAMNKKASDLYMQNSFFVDPAGISEMNYSTASDLAKLGSEVMHHKVLSKIVGTKKHIIYDSSGNTLYNIENLNRLLGIYGVDGVKTGFTQEAGDVLVTSKETDGHRLVIVVMRSDDRFADTRRLIHQVGEHITYQPIHF